MRSVLLVACSMNGPKQHLSVPIHLVRNGVPEPVGSRVPKSSETLRVGFVGRLDLGPKRVLDLICILDSSHARGERISLTVVGGGPAEGILLRELGRFTGVHEIEIVGFADRDHLYKEIYPRLDCILLTSEQEGSPLVLIEAMQHGVVPVSSRFGHAAEGLLSPGLNSLTFSVGDAAAAAASLKQLSHDRALLIRLAEQAKGSAANYTKDRMMNGWKEVFFGLLERQPRIALQRPLRSRRVYGRLERFGMPTQVANHRRLMGKAFNHGSGFDEWPGSLNMDGGLEERIRGKLREIEEVRCAALYS